MGLVDDIKKESQRSGEGKGKFFYVKSGDKKRIRFLQDANEGVEVPWHKDWDKQVNHPCQKFLGKGSCPYCDDGNDTRPQYGWSVWDYDASSVKILMYGVNRCSPVDAIISCYEEYGTIKDRDYVISSTGSNTDRRYSVTPKDRTKFRNDKAKPYTKQALIKLLAEAYPCDIGKSDSKGKKNRKGSAEEELWDGAMNEPEEDYSSMTPKQLFKLCEDRGIEAKPRKDSLYYIELLEADDAKEEEEEDSWGDDEEGGSQDYSSMSPMELYKLCRDRRLDAEKKKPKQYYITILKEADEASDDWGDNDEEEDEEDWESD